MTDRRCACEFCDADATEARFCTGCSRYCFPRGREVPSATRELLHRLVAANEELSRASGVAPVDPTPASVLVGRIVSNVGDEVATGAAKAARGWFDRVATDIARGGKRKR